MSGYAEMELELRSAGSDGFRVEVRFTPPGSDTEVRKSGAMAAADLSALAGIRPETDAYGNGLAHAVFRDSQVAVAFEQARALAAAQNALLRIRLLLDPDDSDLHRIHWECMRDLAGHRLFTGERVSFSRYQSSTDLRGLRQSPGGTLKALVVVASPSNVDQYEPGGVTLAPVDEAAERSRAERALHTSAEITHLPVASLDAIEAELRKGYDIFYLVCHGAFAGGEAKLWLTDSQGRAEVVSGSDVVERIREMELRPRLAVLASCQSAGGTRQGVPYGLRALGPGLAEAGIPAVLAMQGNLNMDTEAVFMPTFFRELLSDGQIDRAVAVARGAVRHRADYWVPVLYMRVRNGRLWNPIEPSAARPPASLSAARPEIVPTAPPGPAPSSRSKFPWIAAVVIAVIAIGAAVAYFASKNNPTPINSTSGPVRSMPPVPASSTPPDSASHEAPKQVSAPPAAASTATPTPAPADSGVLPPTGLTVGVH